MTVPPTTDDRTGSVAPQDHPPIAFADADWQWFVDALAAQELPAPESTADLRATCEALYGHLVGVNRWLNLTRLVAPHDWLKYHLLDSLLLLGDKRLRHLRQGAPVVDLGSGGGYPGLPLAFWLPGYPWVLVDSRQRKVAFLQAAATLLPEAQVEARCFRGREAVCQAPDLRRRCQVVVSRAAAAVDKLLVETRDLVAPNGYLLVAKGPAYAGEEHERALRQAGKAGFRFVSDRAVRLTPEDPERRIVVWRRVH